MSEQDSMSDETTPIEIRTDDDHKTPTRRRHLRFGLLDLMLLTTAIATWLPYFYATPQFQALQSENDHLRKLAELLIIEDPTKIHVLQVRSNRFGAKSWKLYVPAAAQCELRFATENLSSLTHPNQFDHVPLERGEHRISMIRETTSESHRYQVFIDRNLAIEKEYPRDWVHYNSSSSSAAGSDLVQFAPDQVFELRSQRFDETVAGFTNSSGRNASEIPGKGSALWIAPVGFVHADLPLFVSPNLARFNERSWGFLEGIRIRLERFFSPSNNAVRGAIQISHSGTWLNRNRSINQISIKPRLQGQSGYADSIMESNEENAQIAGLELASSDTGQRPKNAWDVADGVISDDGQQMDVFLHTEPFASGARPVVHVRFHARNRNRVGFRVFAEEGSPPLSECLLTAIDGSFSHLRRVELASDQMKSVDQLFSFPVVAPPTSEPTNEDIPEVEPPSFSWETYPADQFPLSDDGLLRRVTLTSDVTDYSKIQYAKSVKRGLHYDGYGAKQSWLFAAEEDATVAFRPATAYRTSSAPIPGGPVVDAAELRMPLNPERWIWFEVEPVREGEEGE